MEVTGVVSQLNGVGLGVMASVHGDVTARAQRRQRARSAPSSSRRRMAAHTGEWVATRRPPVAWAALGGAVHAAPLSGGRKAAAGVGHGAAHLLLLVADARKAPGVRAVQEQGGGDGEQGDTAALSRSTTSSEENDSVLKLFLNFTKLDIDNALQVFDRMIWQAEKFSWSWDLVR